MASCVIRGTKDCFIEIEQEQIREGQAIIGCEDAKILTASPVDLDDFVGSLQCCEQIPVGPEGKVDRGQVTGQIREDTDQRSG